MLRKLLYLVAGFAPALAVVSANLDCGKSESKPDTGGAVVTGGSSCALDSGQGILCGGSCIDVTNDIANCGNCAHACAATEICAAGTCASVAGSLTGLRWELPCSGTGSAAVNCASRYDGGAAVVKTAMVQGVDGATYTVTLRFRGIIEQKTYAGGTRGGATGAGPDGGTNADFFLVGGTPAGDTWNIYRLSVSDPTTTYYLNAGSSGSDQVFPVDYRADLPIKAGAIVTLTADSVEGVETRNIGPDGGPVVVPGIPPSPDWYNGQFIQMDVESVVLAR